MAALDNARHEKFAQCLASGMSQRKAYRAAFPQAEKWKDETVDVRASQLKNTDKVLIRLDELREEATSKAIMNVIERKEWLTRIIKSDEEYTKDKLRAVDVLNRMEGSYDDRTEADREEQQARIEKLKAETARIKGEDTDGDTQDDGFIDALRGEVADAWQD